LTAQAVQPAQEVSLFLHGIDLPGAAFCITSAHGIAIPAIIVMPDIALTTAGVAQDGPAPLRNTANARRKAAICRAKKRVNMGWTL
jgi:hypothetical protein